MSNAFVQFGNNLFGSIAGPTALGFPIDADFIPYKSGRTIDIKGNTATWLGLRSPIQQKYAYEYCYPVAAIIDRMAEYDLNGIVEVLRDKGKGANDYATGSFADNLNKLFTQPNPDQAWFNFRGQQLVYKRVFGFCPVLPLVAVGFEFEGAASMVNLPPWRFDVDLSDDEFPYMFRFPNGDVKKFKKDQIILLQDSFMQDEAKNFKLPLSRIVGLDFAVSNICAAMEADNVLLKKKGPLGFISDDAAASKDSMNGYVPMSTKQKRVLQTALSRYGLSWSQYQYIVSRRAVKWIPISYNVAELRTSEKVIEGEKAICHRYNFPYLLYEMSDSAYAANGNNAEKNCYTSNIIPNNQRDFAEFNRWFRTRENNVKLCVDFDAVPCLQVNKKEAADARKAMNEACQIEFENNLITLNQWRTAVGYDTVEGGDVYYSDMKQAEPKNEPLPKETKEAA